MNCDTNNGGGKKTIEDHDEPLRDLNSRLSNQSECDEDESWFEADYEPEDNTDTEEIRNESDETKEAADSERSHRYLLSSDAEDDDIEVIDVINHEKQTRRTPVEEVKASSGLMDRLPSSWEEKNSHRILSRSNTGTESIKHKYEPSQLNHTKGSPEGKNENQGVLKEKKYSRADLEKVKAFFSANRNKRKESDNIMYPSKRIKGDYGGKVGNYRSEPSQEMLERKGKNFFLKNEVVSKGPDTFRGELRKSRRSEESPHQRELSSDSASSRDKKINSLFSRHYSTSRTLRYNSGYMSNPEDGMLVVDPSNLRILPNGQIMIKSDDGKSLKNRTGQT